MLSFFRARRQVRAIHEVIDELMPDMAKNPDVVARVTAAITGLQLRKAAAERDVDHLRRTYEPTRHRTMLDLRGTVVQSTGAGRSPGSLKERMR